MVVGRGGGGGGPAKMRKILQNLGSCPAKANSQVGKSAWGGGGGGGGGGGVASWRPLATKYQLQNCCRKLTYNID